MSARELSDAELLDKLNAHPELRERVGTLLLTVEDEQGDLREADAVEIRLIEELRQMGRESLSAWAQQQVRRTTEAACEVGGTWRGGKKN